MFLTNPFLLLSETVPTILMQIFVIVMALLVIIGTLLDIIHKKNLSLLMLSDEQKIDDLAIYVHRKNIERGRFRSRKISLSSKFVENLPKIRAQIGGIWGAWLRKFPELTRATLKGPNAKKTILI